MALQGDLSTLELADLLQNLELHGRTGVLSVEGEQGKAHIYFKDGKLTLFASDSRPSLMEVLVASGTATPDVLEAARTARKGSRKSLGEVLVSQGVLDAEELKRMATARLLDDACEWVSAEGGVFTFHEGRVPRGVFDPEERRLDLALPAGPLLLEAARRSDHWQRIRSRIPSDSAHYLVHRPPRGEPQGEAGLQEALLARLDGTRSIAEVLASFPHRRFEAYELLANLTEAGSLRPAAAEDLAGIVRAATEEAPERGWDLVERGLEAQPNHPGLLAEKVRLADELGRPEAACDALKLLVHLALEGGQADDARAYLARAKDLDPGDTALWEKSLALAVDDARLDDAFADGRHLAELYRTPGLHRKACAVFETLVELDPDAWDFHRELARSRADCGELPRAISALEAHGKPLLARERYDDALRVYAEILALDPSNAAAQRTQEQIESGILAAKRARRRKIVRVVSIALGATLLATWLALETAARLAYDRCAREVSRRYLIEETHYAEALSLFEDVRTRFPYSTTALFDVRSRVAELEMKLHAPQPGE